MICGFSFWGGEEREGTFTGIHMLPLLLVKIYHVRYVGVERTTKNWGKCVNKILILVTINGVV